ncbi:MAG TPA: Hsp20/alpha crystallin family protein [Pirellulaceae bacterium]|nr:Hsp20/alpha crystallin family protein [Pirellulaceae bacterium]HMO90660.1 Hsp20/alpha crystallin family protein [Pirellulaceae bacterium]HMP67761.1 Hsp20/alpha crystallin family protein [Pirellulaceae bacterium]
MSKTLINRPEGQRRTPFGMVPWFNNDVFDIERLMNSVFNGETGLTAEALVARMDVIETDHNIEVMMDLPGVQPGEIDIRVENNLLTIRGERTENKEEKDEKRQFHRIERRYGNFSRSVVLPCAVNDAEAVAEFKDGVLKVVLPKTEMAKPRKIKVK